MPSSRLHFRETNPTVKTALPLLKTNAMSKDSPMSNESNLLLRIMESHGPRKSIIDSTNHWIERNINLQLSARSIETKDGIIKLSNIHVDLDEDYSIPLKGNFIRTPRYCRDNNTTYKGVIKADAVFIPTKQISGFNPLVSENNSLTHRQKTDSKIVTSEKNITLGKIPIMLQSNLCILSNLSEGQRLNLGECTNDYGGSYIIEGTEKAIISQEKLRTGEYITWTDNDTGKIECVITCVTDSGTTIVSIIPGTKWDTLKVGIHYAGRKKHIPLYVAFAFLGYNESNATDLISHFIPVHLRVATMMYLQSSMIRARSIGSNIIAYIIAKKAKQKGNVKSHIENQEEITKAVRKDLFTNIKSLNGKAKSLAFMASQVIMCIMGERPKNNRDS